MPLIQNEIKAWNQKETMEARKEDTAQPGQSTRENNNEDGKNIKESAMIQVL